MILEFPSGFYKSVIPPAIGNTGNVTYTISDSPPPRGSLFFLKIGENLAQTSPALEATEPQGIIETSTLQSFRSQSIIDREPRPVGSALEFNDRYKNLEAPRDPLDQSVDFSRFSAPETDAVNPQLTEAYGTFQRELIEVSQTSLDKQVEIENVERETNTLIASLEATDAALELLPNDQGLQDAKVTLETKITTNEATIDTLTIEVEALGERRLELEGVIRKLSKVIQ